VLEQAIHHQNEREILVSFWWLLNRLAVIIDVPRCEMLERREGGAAQRARAIRHDARHIAAERQRKLPRVRRELVPGVLQVVAVVEHFGQAHSFTIGSRRFFLMDGDWFEIGADYVRASREAIGRLFPAMPSVDLPPWYLPKGRTEYDYNSDAAVRRRGYLCLDRNASVRDPLGARSSLEICDLLGPRNELIHVKRAKGSAPLSHLFSQGLISAQSLVSGPPAVGNASPPRSPPCQAGAPSQPASSRRRSSMPS
jgi:hypothetical protein